MQQKERCNEKCLEHKYNMHVSKTIVKDGIKRDEWVGIDESNDDGADSQDKELKVS